MSKPRLLADENIPRTVITQLRRKGYDIISVWELKPGISDEEVIELAIRESRIIITFDKDFGRIALTKPNITGVILLRIPPLNPQYIANKVLAVLGSVENLYGKLVIVRKRTIKIVNITL